MDDFLWNFEDFSDFGQIKISDMTHMKLEKHRSDASTLDTSIRFASVGDIISQDRILNNIKYSLDRS
jgi:hypothetical protein